MKKNKCNHCKEKGQWNYPITSTHHVTLKCDYCNGTGKENKKLELLMKDIKAYKQRLSPWEELDKEGMIIC